MSSSSEDEKNCEEQKQNQEKQIVETSQEPAHSFLANFNQIPTKPRKKYGNMIVFCQRPFFISIGPDYWCFIPAFIIFGIAAFFVTRFVFNHSNSFWFQMITAGICGGFILSYLAVGTSNPGVVTQSQNQEQQENRIDQRKPRYCKKCDLKIKKGTRHCDECNVCIDGYDHHCPWTSKCIGSGNLCRFYWFLSMVPIFLIYIFVAFSVVMASIPHQTRYQIRKHGTPHL